MLRFLFVVMYMKRSYNVIPETKLYKEWKLKCALVVLRVLLRNRAKTTRCRGIKNKRRVDLRNIFSLMAHIMDPYDQKEIREPDKVSVVTNEVRRGKVIGIIPSGNCTNRAKSLIYKLLSCNVILRDFKVKLYKMYEHINYIGSTFKTRNIFLKGKVSIL